MARELGFQPRSLIKNIPSPSQKWKAPVSEWVRSLYDEKIGARKPAGGAPSAPAVRERVIEFRNPEHPWSDKPHIPELVLYDSFDGVGRRRPPSGGCPRLRCRQRDLSWPAMRFWAVSQASKDAMPGPRLRGAAVPAAVRKIPVQLRAIRRRAESHAVRQDPRVSGAPAADRRQAGQICASPQERR